MTSSLNEFLGPLEESLLDARVHMPMPAVIRITATCLEVEWLLLSTHFSVNNDATREPCNHKIETLNQTKANCYLQT